VFEQSELFNDKIEIRTGKDSFIMIERWKLFKPHIARRSFATNSASRGVPIRAIMNQGGWSSISQVQKYIQHDNESDIKSLESSFRDLNMEVNEG